MCDTFYNKECAFGVCVNNTCVCDSRNVFAGEDLYAEDVAAPCLSYRPVLVSAYAVSGFLYLLALVGSWRNTTKKSQRLRLMPLFAECFVFSLHCMYKTIFVDQRFLGSDFTTTFLHALGVSLGILVISVFLSKYLEFLQRVLSLNWSPGLAASVKWSRWGLDYLPVAGFVLTGFTVVGIFTITQTSRILFFTYMNGVFFIFIGLAIILELLLSRIHKQILEMLSSAQEQDPTRDVGKLQRTAKSVRKIWMNSRVTLLCTNFGLLLTVGSPGYFMYQYVHPLTMVAGSASAVANFMYNRKPKVKVTVETTEAVNGDLRPTV